MLDLRRKRRRIAIFTLFGRASLGREKIQNGGFDTTDFWALGAGLSIGSGLLVATSSGAARQATNTPLTSIVPGRSYRTVFTVTAYTSGSVTIRLGGAVGTIRGATGTFTEDLTATTAAAPFLNYTSTAALSVDNVSVREIP